MEDIVRSSFDNVPEQKLFLFSGNVCLFVYVINIVKIITKVANAYISTMLCLLLLSIAEILTPIL